MTSDPKLDTNRLFVSSVEKAFMVLDAFRGDRLDLGISDIMKRTGLDKSATQRYTHTLEQLNYLHKDPQTRRYAMTQKVLEAANSFLRVNPLVARATPYLVDLRSKFDARVGLARVHGDRSMYLLPLQSNNVAYRTAQAGFAVPLFCSSSGRLFLSYREDTDVRAFLEATDRKKITPETITDVETILSHVRACRKKGFCITEQELRLGDINLALPVLGPGGVVEAALVIVCSRHDWTAQRMLDEIYPTAIGAARSIATDG